MAKDWATFEAPSAEGPALESGVDLHLDLDPMLGRQAGLERALRDAIRSGRLAEQARLPSTRMLAAELGLARNTVSAAYDQLIAEGYLVARHGSGTVVAPTTRESPDKSSGSAAVTPALAQDIRPGYAATPRHDLRPGSPDVSHFPVAAWLRAGRRALGAAPSEAFGYGDPRGRIELRTALADYLGRTRGVLARPEQIVVTCGSLQALALLSTVLFANGTRSIAMEDPGIGLHRRAVGQAGPEVIPVPVDGDGIRIDLLADSGAQAVVVTPGHQYPTGVTLHPARRHALAQWARAGGIVIEDDYDGEFRYDRQPVGAIQGMAPEHVVYVGTTSKTLGPALRLAWMVLPPHLVEPVALAKQLADHQTETLGQLTLAELIRDHGYDRHIRACRLRYRRRRDLLIDRLTPRAGRPLPGLALHGIAAGLHALLTLPEGGPGEAEVIERATARGLALDGLGEHWHGEPDPLDRSKRLEGIIIGYAGPDERAYPAALDALVRVLSMP